MADGITIRALFVRLGVIADDDKAEKFDRKIDQVKKSMIGLEGRLKGFATSVAASLATAFAGVALTNAITETAELGDTAAKAGKAIGLSAEAYQELAFAAERSGTSINVMQKGMQRLGKRALEASRGSASAKKEFEELGIAWDDANGIARAQEDLLADISDRFRDVIPVTEKSGVAMKIFGKAGAEMIPFLNEGSSGIAKLRQQARDLGGVMSNETAASAEKVIDAMSNLKTVLRGLRSSIITQLFPSLIKGGEAFSVWVSQGGGAEKIVLALKRAVVALGVALAGVALVRTGQGLAAVGAQAAALVPKLIAATAAMVKMALSSVNLKSILTGAGGLVRGFFSLKTVILGLNAALLVIPIALGAILLAGQDLSVWLQGGESLIGSFIERWRESSGPLGMAARLLESIAPTLASLFEQVQAMASNALPSLAAGFSSFAVNALKTVRELLAEFGPPVLDAIKQIIASGQEILPRVVRAGRAIVGAALRIFAALLPPALAFIAQVAKLIETLAPIVAGLVGAIADIIAAVAPKVSAVLTFVAGLITGIAAFILRILSAVVGVVAPITTQILSWWDTLAEQAGAVLDSIKSGIDTVAEVLAPLLKGLDLAIDAAETLFGFGGGGSTSTQPERQGSILGNIRSDVEGGMMGRGPGSQAGATGTTIEIASVQTTVQPQPGATQVEAARETRRAVLGSLEQELARAGRDFG